MKKELNLTCVSRYPLSGKLRTASRTAVGLMAGFLYMLFTPAARSQDVVTNKEIIDLQTSKVSQDIILTKISASKCQFDLSSKGLVGLKNGRVSEKVIKEMFRASPPADLMTNEDVILLSEAELPKSLILEKIKNTSHKFDVSSEALINLKTAKVSDAVVKEMLLHPVSERSNATPLPPMSKASLKEPTPPPAETAKEKPSPTSRPASTIIITTVYDEVKGLRRMGELTASAKRIYGSQPKLRAEAIEDIKKQALAKGATHVYIQSENFSPTPINTVSLVGVAYKK